MNIFKKCWYRTVQFAFRLCIPFLPYHDPKLFYDLNEILNILKSEGLKKPIIITGKSTGSLELFQNMLKNLDSNGTQYYHFNEVSANPTTDMVLKAYDAYLNNKCDSIIAFGGGSVIDAGKALGVKIVKPNKDLIKFKGVMKVMHKIPPFIAIPTTAGTGSEVTVASVIIDSKTNHKVSINDFNLIPNYAILDSNLLTTLPSHLISTCGMDALTHSIEAFIGNSSTRKTRKDSLESIKLIFDNIKEAYNNKTTESLHNMLRASYLAGRAFTISYVGNVHAMSHPLSGAYNTPHGYANAVILPVVLKEYGKAIDKKMKSIAIYLGYADKNTDANQANSLMIEKINQLLKELNIDYSRLEIKDEDINRFASYAYKEANPLYPVPVMFDIKDFVRIYHELQDLKDGK